MGALTRRRLLAGSASLIGMGQAPDPSALPADDAIAFRLMRGGEPIGTHALAFHRRPDGLDVFISVNVLVRVGPIPFVRYRHNGMERWRGGRLVMLGTNTDRNGTLLEMQAHRQPHGLHVTGSGTQPYIAPEEALPTTYWNRRLLHVPMIGTQDGGLVHPHVTDAGIEQIPVASGERIAAQRYELRGDLELTLYYDTAGRWAGLRFVPPVGGEVSYERL
jgi:hypothetical protein